VEREERERDEREHISFLGFGTLLVATNEWKKGKKHILDNGGEPESDDLPGARMVEAMSECARAGDDKK